MNWLDSKKFSSYWRFFNEYVRSSVHPVLGYTMILGTKNEEQLHTELAPYLVRCKADEVGNMPEIVHTPVRIPIEGKQRTLYNRLRKAKDIEVDVHDLRDALAGKYTYFDENSKLYLNAKAKAMRLRQVVNDTRHFEQDGVHLVDPKIEWITEYVQDAPDVPILIFTLFRDEALAVADALAQDGVQPALLLGGTQNSEWYTSGVQQAEVFLDRKTNVLVGTIDVLAESLDLPFVQVSIFVGIKRDQIMMTQALGRMKRFGSTGTRQAIYLLGEHTIDETDYEAHTKQLDDLQWLELAIAQGVFNNDAIAD
jgi:superfamily II DNA/RNA helicase